MWVGWKGHAMVGRLVDLISLSDESSVAARVVQKAVARVDLTDYWDVQWELMTVVRTA